MSKSLGNFYTIREILEIYTSETLRYFLISTHYRKPIHYNEEALDLAKRILEKFYTAFEFSKDAKLQINTDFSEKSSDELNNTIIQTERNFIDAMDDDFNTSLALTHLQSLVRNINKIASAGEFVSVKILEKAHQLLFTLGNIFGLFSKMRMGLSDNLVELLLEIRQEARVNKNYTLADEIRHKLNKLNIEIKDLPQKTIWYKKI